VFDPPGVGGGVLTPLDGLADLDRLALHVRRGMGDRPGDRRFPGHPQPSGIEVETHSVYAPGDDLRHIDWNAVGRLDTLLVRRFAAEREVTVHLLLDASASMAVPARDRKLAVAAELARALAYVALSANDAVRVAVLAGDAPLRPGPVFRQRASITRVAKFLDAVTAGGRLALGGALESHARQFARPGVAIVISDLMAEPAEIERGLLALRARRYEVLLLQVVGRAELEPERDFSGGLLRDVESGETHPMVLGADVLARYRALLDAHLSALASLAARFQTTYARLVTGTSVHDFVAVELARLGVVRHR
jgi:uncharacterized protein (DUF58 family)